jgi:hypothetical protein
VTGQKYFQLRKLKKPLGTDLLALFPAEATSQVEAQKGEQF